MLWLIVIALVLVVVGVAALRLRPDAGRPASLAHLPYRKTRSVFSPAERQFYDVLHKAVGERYVIFAKMRMSDLLWIDAKGQERNSARGRISQKHADFILLDRDTLSPELVIELDDSSHQLEKRRERDALVDAIYREAGLPVLHVAVARSYAAGEVSRQVAEALSPPAG